MPVLDEHLTYKIIEELDEWKKVQQSSFLCDLKTKEVKFLEHLRNLWNQKQATYESDLVQKAEKLQLLTKSIED